MINRLLNFMELKITLSNILNFIVNKIIQIFGIIVVIFGITFFLSLISYSPSDPNFIFPSEREISNLIGIKGSILSDFFFQSIGLISFLIPLTFIFAGINIFFSKKNYNNFRKYFFYNFIFANWINVSILFL